MSNLLLVRATIQMVGVDIDERVLVDPDDPEIAVYLAKEYLVPVNGESTYEVVADEPQTLPFDDAQLERLDALGDPTAE